MIVDLAIANNWNVELRRKQLHGAYVRSPELGGDERRHAEPAREPIVA